MSMIALNNNDTTTDYMEDELIRMECERYFDSLEAEEAELVSSYGKKTKRARTRRCRKKAKKKSACILRVLLQKLRKEESQHAKNPTFSSAKPLFRRIKAVDKRCKTKGTQPQAE